MTEKVVEYPESVKAAVKALCEELEKAYPGIADERYESGDNEWTFTERMEFGLYIELVKAGKVK